MLKSTLRESFALTRAELLDYSIEANVHGILCFGMGLTLRDGNRQYFYEKLDEHFPGLKERYIKEFGDSYGVGSPNNDELMKYFKGRTADAGIMSDTYEILTYLREFPQKSVQSKLI